MDVIAKFEQHLTARREPWRVRSAHLGCALDFVDWAKKTLDASGGWANLVEQDRAALEACRERYLSETIAERDLRGEERLRLNRFIRFVEASAREETSQIALQYPALPIAAHTGAVRHETRAHGSPVQANRAP